MCMYVCIYIYIYIPRGPCLETDAGAPIKLERPVKLEHLFPSQPVCLSY